MRPTAQQLRQQTPPTPQLQLPAPASAPAPENQKEPWGWNRRQRLALGFLLALLAIFLIVQQIRRPFRLHQPAPVIISGQPTSLPTRLDPNTATEPDLALIPHLGDTLASKIIQYREARRAAIPDGIVFHQPADLDPIPGIGKKLIDQVTPYLQFSSDAPDTP